MIPVPWMLLALAQANSTRLPDDSLVSLKLRSGSTLEVAGANWQERATMWEECALLSWAYQGAGAFDSERLSSFDGGSSSLRTVYVVPHRDLAWKGFDWSADGHFYGGVLDLNHGVVAVEATTGDARSLLTLPREITSYELREVFDPYLVRDPRACVADGSRFLVLLQQKGNRGIDRWLGRPEPTIGHWLVAASPEARGLCFESGSAPLPGDARSWSVAVRRHRLFVLLSDGCLREISLEGEPQIRAEVELRGVASIAVSPDEKWLMLECEERPAGPPPRLRSAPGAWGQLQDSISSKMSGFVLFDLERGEVVRGPDSAGVSCWSPDSRHIAFLVAADSVEIYALASRSARLLVRRSFEPVEKAARAGIRPLWSGDGRRLAMSLGCYSRTRGPRVDLAMDLERHEILELPEFGDDSTWAPISAPFPDGFHFVGDFPPVRWE